VPGPPPEQRGGAPEPSIWPAPGHVFITPARQVAGLRRACNTLRGVSPL